ncbi:hypothetical protein BDQ17DRAFT_238363 [Cyathus striatus]|nr:hypothetical protein BDQ17DRAFT_238363 [Cyathus striatus]
MLLFLLGRRQLQDCGCYIACGCCILSVAFILSCGRSRMRVSGCGTKDDRRIKIGPSRAKTLVSSRVVNQMPIGREFLYRIVLKLLSESFTLLDMFKQQCVLSQTLTFLSFLPHQSQYAHSPSHSQPPTPPPLRIAQEIRPYLAQDSCLSSRSHTISLTWCTRAVVVCVV